MSITVKQRQAIEKQIVASAIADLLEAGFEITVNDGEEDVLERSTDPEAIAAAMMSTDEDRLYVYYVGTPTNNDEGSNHKGWIRFIYGNDGPDVINDYTTNLEKYLSETIALAETLDEEMQR
jgi:hypothetical protein